MKVIGLCGGSGSGKGAVSRIFREYGIPTVDTDAVYRELTASDGECMRALVSEFGGSVKTSDGSLCREALRAIVFSGENMDANREKLNKITHKFILLRTRELLEQYRADGKKMAVIDAPLLFESGFDKECDITLAVLADRDVRIGRITSRDGITRAAAEERINTQIPDKELMQMADLTVTNNSTLDALRESVNNLLKTINEQLKAETQQKAGK